MENNSTFNLPTQSVLPLGTSAPVIGNGKAIGFSLTNKSNNTVEDAYGKVGFFGSGAISNMFGTSGNTLPSTAGNYKNAYANYDASQYGLNTNPNKSGVVADLSKSTGAQAIVCIKY